MGVAAVGATTELSEIARRTAPLIFGSGGAGGARMLMDGRTVSPVGAAMAGAFTVDSIDAHDGTTPCKGHAGSAIFPALIAMAQASGQQIDGRRFAEILATAYEISYRAGSGAARHLRRLPHLGGLDRCWCGCCRSQAAGRECRSDPPCGRGSAEYHGPRSQMMRCIDHPTMLRDGVGWGAPSGRDGGLSGDGRLYRCPGADLRR